MPCTPSLPYSDALHVSGHLGADGPDYVAARPSDPTPSPLILCISEPRKAAGGNVAAFPSSPGSAAIRDMWLGRAGLSWNQRFLLLAVRP